jgi:pimeloyl-ACP methyl ester carboxylesterase
VAERIVYLHGFASGPTSRKARFFDEKLRETGRTLEAPDLSEGDFEHLTVGGQLGVLERLLAGDPAILIGSSLGGYLASLYASTHPEVRRLILLAPAFGFGERWSVIVPPEEVERWRATGKLPVYHYGEQRHRNLGFGIYEESARWPLYPEFTQPAHIFHGTRDTVVPPAISEAYAASHANVRLTLLDSGHELTDVLPEIWREAISSF